MDTSGSIKAWRRIRRVKRSIQNRTMPHKRWSLERLRSESDYWRSCILITAGQLNLFAWIGKLEKTPFDLAAHFGGKPAGWGIFCNALCAMGLLRKRGGKYANK